MVNKSKSKALKNEIIQKSVKGLNVEKIEYSVKDSNDYLDNTEVYDEVDIANAYERDLVSKAINEHRTKLLPETDPNFDGENCLDCGSEIPEQRLAMGKIRCVICQDKIEKRKKLFAG